MNVKCSWMMAFFSNSNQGDSLVIGVVVYNIFVLYPSSTGKGKDDTSTWLQSTSTLTCKDICKYSNHFINYLKCVCVCVCLKFGLLFWIKFLKTVTVKKKSVILDIYFSLKNFFFEEPELSNLGVVVFVD